MKYIKQYIEEKYFLHPLGEVTLEQSVNQGGWSGVYIRVNEVKTGLFVSHVDYAEWLESKIDIISPKTEQDPSALLEQEPVKSEDPVSITFDENPNVATEDPVPTAEPRFEIGDWIFSSVLGTSRIIGMDHSNYQLETTDGKRKSSSIDYVDYIYDKWTFANAKDGDILVSKQDVFLFKTINDAGISYYGSAHIDESFNSAFRCDSYLDDNLGEIYPATKEQRDLLFQTMDKFGYKWNSQKKQFDCMTVLL